MSERLREVSEVAAGPRIDLLGVEAERAGVAEEALAELAAALDLADLAQRRDEPERADEERALVADEAVIGLLGAVAQDEAAFGELVGDRDHGAADALVVGRQKAQQRHQQEGGVEGGGVVVLDEHAPFVDAVLTDVGVDLVGGRAPALFVFGVLAQCGEAGPAIARHPAHQLR